MTEYPSGKNIDFHTACKEGNLERVQELILDHTVNVNYRSDGDPPILVACIGRHLDVVKFLLEHPRIDIMQASVRNNRHNDVSHEVCAWPSTELLARLLTHPRCDVKTPSILGRNVFHSACFFGHIPIVEMLLEHGEIDPDQPDRQNGSPFFASAQNGHLEVVRYLLASDWLFDTTRRFEAGENRWNSTTAAEWAVLHGAGTVTQIIPEKHHERSKLNGKAIAALINQYEANPVQVRESLRHLPSIRNFYIRKLFAIVMFFTEGLCDLDKKHTPFKVARFLGICARLPLELQAIVCCRSYSSPVDMLPSEDREKGFQWLAKRMTKAM